MAEKVRSYKEVFCGAVVILMMLTSVTVSAADCPLIVSQVFETASSSAEAAFTYRLVPMNPNNPMPADSTPEGYTFQITGSNSADIGLFNFTEQGVYHYELFHVCEQEEYGYICDKRAYKIEVYVDAALNVEYTVKNTDNIKVADIEFLNEYIISPSDPSLMADPPVVKTVAGNPGINSAFIFKLEARDPSQPMPEGSINGVKTLAIEGTGQGEFGTWSYYEPGTYYYTVYELNTGESGYIYDNTVYTITDTVKEADGQLTLSRVVTNHLNRQVRTFTFINTYTGESGRPSNPPAPGSPPTSNNPRQPRPNPGQLSMNPLPPTRLLTSAPSYIQDVPEEPGQTDADGFKAPDNKLIPGRYVDIKDKYVPKKPLALNIDGPNTGDNMNINFYVALSVLGGVMTTGAATYLIVDGKRKKDDEL